MRSFCSETKKQNKEKERERDNGPVGASDI